MVSNSTVEWSLSKLKLIKNELRSSMLQERTSMLIESDIVLNIDFTSYFCLFQMLTKETKALSIAHAVEQF